MSAAGSQPSRHCRVCGDPGHRSRDCPYINSEEEEDQIATPVREALEMDAASEISHYRKGRLAHPGAGDAVTTMEGTPVQGRRRRVPREASWEEVATPTSIFHQTPKAKAMMGRAQHYNLDEEDTPIQLTEKEMKALVRSREKASRAAAKKTEVAALTGIRAEYPSLSNCWSGEVAINMVESFRSRMMTYLWKKLVWQLRVKAAVTMSYPGAHWKKNPRWLAMLIGKEVAAQWGHLGALRQRLHSPASLALM
eukprot:s129_g11.t1